MSDIRHPDAIKDLSPTCREVLRALHEAIGKATPGADKEFAVSEYRRVASMWGVAAHVELP